MEKKDFKLTDQERAYIRELLRETRSQFRDRFLELANSDLIDDRDEFMRIRELLLEYVVPKQGKLPPAPVTKEELNGCILSILEDEAVQALFKEALIMLGSSSDKEDRDLFVTVYRDLSCMLGYEWDRKKSFEDLLDMAEKCIENQNYNEKRNN